MVMGCKNKCLGTENKNFSPNQSEATQEEKGQSVFQQHVWMALCCSSGTGNGIRGQNSYSRAGGGSGTYRAA